MGGQEHEFVKEAFESNYIAPLGPCRFRNGQDSLIGYYLPKSAYSFRDGES